MKYCGRVKAELNLTFLIHNVTLKIRDIYTTVGFHSSELCNVIYGRHCRDGMVDNMSTHERFSV